MLKLVLILTKCLYKLTLTLAKPLPEMQQLARAGSAHRLLQAKQNSQEEARKKFWLNLGEQRALNPTLCLHGELCHKQEMQMSLEFKVLKTQESHL